MTVIEKRNAPGLKPMDAILSHVTIVHGSSGGGGDGSTSSSPGLIFCSGQVPADETGALVPGDIRAHTRQCIQNLEKALRGAGVAGLQNLVKVNIFLRSMDDFAAMNEVYQEMIPSPKPSRTCIQAGKLPLDTDIEIEAIAAKAKL
ncbi:unnamed protein product [Parajaminaea phylloscopi]